MRIRIRHQIRLGFTAAVRSTIKRVQMTPRSHDGQFCKSWRIDLGADGRVQKDDDAFGNITHMFWLEGGLQELVITAEGEVDTLNTDGIVRGALERMPLGFWLRETPTTRPTAQTREFAAEVAAASGGNALSALHRLNDGLPGWQRQLQEQAGQAQRQSLAAAIPPAALTATDLTERFIAAARCLGHPARAIRGYVLEEQEGEPTGPHSREHGDLWAEAHVPGLGWVGFDPLRQQCPTARYVRVNVGPDALSVAPFRGASPPGTREVLGDEVTLSPGRVILEG
jgi:transglutaminase-like putative cysteine protease